MCFKTEVYLSSFRNTIHMAFHSLQPLRILFKSCERMQENKSERIYYYKRKMVS